MYDVQHIDRPLNGGSYAVFCENELIAAFFGPLAKVRAEDYVAWMQRDDLENGGEV